MRVALEGRLADLSSGDRARLLDRRAADQAAVRDDTRRLLDDVRRRGDPALREQVLRFDRVQLDRLEVPRARWDRALDDLDPAVRTALERAARNIEVFHRAQLPGEVTVEVEPGVRLGRRFVPLPAVGVYAPGGRAAYPSSVLMGVVPARSAGVEEIVVCSPPGPDGLPPDVVMAAAALGGATKLVAAGGAGAVGAMAFGTETVPRCAAVVGPGNRWVLEAKRQVAGEVIIDSPAGPSEVLVVADDTADPALVAAELLAQAEHDPDARVALVTSSAAILEATRRALAEQLAGAPRREVAAAALAGGGALLLADDTDEALDFAEAFAAEHLSLMVREPRRYLDRARTSGTAFLGGASSVAFGDYLTGANHVLPTGGASRSFSGLSVLDFVRSFTWQEVSPEAAGRLAPDTAALARSEGLFAHAAAALLRERPPEGGAP